MTISPEAVLKSTYAPQYQAIVRRLIEARKERCLTQGDLASRLGRPQSFVSKYEHGERRIDVGEFLLITRMLEVDPASIISAATTADSDTSSP